MTVDIALVRPLGAVATVAGLAVIVVSFSFSALGGNSREAWDSLAASPAEFTFKRPLGQFDYEYPRAKNKNKMRDSHHDCYENVKALLLHRQITEIN